MLYVVAWRGIQACNYAHSASVRVKAGSSSDPNVSAGVGLSTGSWPTNWEPGSAFGRSALTRGLPVARSGHREHAGSFPCVVVVPLYAMAGSLSSSIRRKAAWHPSLLRAPVQRRVREARSCAWMQPVLVRMLCSSPYRPGALILEGRFANCHAPIGCSEATRYQLIETPPIPDHH